MSRRRGEASAPGQSDARRYRKRKLSLENAERIVNGLPPKGVRGRRGVWILGVTAKPELIDVPVHRYLSEDQEAELLVGLARGQWWEESLNHHPNEGGAGIAGKIRSAKMKRMGAKPGTPDYTLAILQTMVDGRVFGGLHIELKAVDGKPTDEQLKRGALLMSQGQAFCFAYGADAALAAIRVYLRGEWP